MKSSSNPKFNTTIKSLDIKKALKIKKILKKKSEINRSTIYRTSLTRINKRDEGKYNGQEEISMLSKANLNIIKILNGSANEEILNDPSFLIVNNNDDEKEESIESITNWKKRVCKFKGSPIHTLKKNKHKQNNIKSNFGLNSNISNFSSAIIFSDKRNDSIIKSKVKSNFSKQNKNNEKDKNTINKEKIKKKKNGYKHSSEINLNKYNEEKKFNIDRHRQRSKSIVFRGNALIKGLDKLAIISNINMNSEIDIANERKYKGFLNEIEIMKINENIHDDVNFIQLKKKLSQLKRSIQRKNSEKDYLNSKITKSNNSPKININEEPKEKNEQTLQDQSSNYGSQNKEIKKPYKKMNSSIHSKNILLKDKFRSLIKRKELYDSFDDEEYEDEEISFYISPDSLYIKIFDSILFLASMIYFIFVPYFLSKNYFIKENKSWKSIFLLIDIIYIIDIIFNFFRAYHNFDENLVRRTKKIFLHYLKTWFLLDFIQAIPFYTILGIIENYIKVNNQFKYVYLGHYNINPRLYIILLIKIIKVYKMFYGNITINYFSEILSKNEFFDDHGSFIIAFFITLLIINMNTCLFIFLGINTYPGWVTKLNIQDNSYLYIYLVSVYFVIVTITTVGYGDITGQTFPEIIFQIYLLIIGTIAYSFIISYISNYIIKSNQKSMSFEKNLEILQEIKIHHPSMKNSLYNEVLRNLYNEQLFERKDKNLLFECLPYSLKNKLITEMYKTIIKKFIFFKDIDNSDFVVKVVTSLKPLFALKGDIIIEEGDYIKEIFYVKKGVIGLNISIDLHNPELSLKKYFSLGEIGKFDISYKSNTISQNKNISDINLNSFTNKKEENNLNSSFNYDNIEDIKVIEIRTREHFGDALMFLNERCPLIAKVRTENAELLILRKMEAIEIYSIYPNIWKRINKKSLHNMEQIYLKIKKLVIELSNRYKINIDNDLNKKKSKSNLKKSRFKINNLRKNINSKTDAKPKEENNKKKEIIINEKQGKIIEFHENMGMNLNGKNPINEGEVSIKKNECQKESILSIETTRNVIKKNSAFKYNNFKTFNEVESNNNTKMSKEISNSKTQKKENSKKCSSSIYPNACQSYKSKINNDSNNSNSNLSSYLETKLNQNTYSKNEKLLYNIFTNLTTTQEKSFQLDSSYDNINTISNNKYIKDTNLQSKIKEILIKECINNISPIKKKVTFLKVRDNFNNISITAKSTKQLNYNNYENILTDIKFDKIENNGSERTINDESIMNKSMICKSILKRENEDYKSESFNKSSKIKLLRASQKLLGKNKNDKFFFSRNNNFDLKKVKISIVDNRKFKQKIINKKPIKISKQLNIISKNIQNTSKNIKNPDEFYMNLFNNIIAKESKGFNGEDEDYNNSILNQNSEKEIKFNDSRKSSNATKSLNDSIIPNKDIIKESNLNINTLKKCDNLNFQVEI